MILCEGNSTMEQYEKIKFVIDNFERCVEGDKPKKFSMFFTKKKEQKIVNRFQAIEARLKQLERRD